MQSIYSYKDYRSCLRDYYADCNKRNPKFSLRALASAIGLNVSTVTRIMNGQRNISQATQDRIVSFMKLRDREAEYFGLLVQYCQSTNPADKRACYEQIRLFRKTHLRNLGREHDEYFSNWYNVALRELLNIVSKPTTSRSLSKMLVPSPTPNDIRKSLNLLHKLGLVKRKADGTWELPEKFVSTPNEWTGTAIHSFQIAMAELGKQSLDHFPKAERDISTLTLSLSASGASTVKDILQRARNEILETASSDASVNRVYQLNLQLFPLSTIVKES